MAFAPEDELKKQQAPTADAQQGALPTTSSAPGAGPGASGGKTAQTPQATPAQPFQNLQSYLSANQPQVQAQAEKTAGQLQNTYGQTTGAIDQAKTEYGNQVKAGYAQPNEELVNQATSNPTEFAAKPENVKAFQSLYNDQYTGPGNFEQSDVYGNLAGQVNKATEQAGLVSTIPGLQTYYQSQNPNATKGGNILDAVLMQGSPEAYGKVTQTAKKFGGLQDYLTGATTDIDKAIQEAKTQSSGTSQGLQNQFTGEGGIIPGFQNELTTRLNETRTSKNSEVDKALQDFSQGKLTPEEIQILGLNPNDLSDQVMAASGSLLNVLQNDYGVEPNLNSLFTRQNPNVVYQSPGSIATPEEIQKAQALGQLTGQDLSSYLGATSPTGQLVNPNRTGLEDIKTNLTQRDTDTLGQLTLGLADAWGVPNTPEATASYAMQHPQEALNRAKEFEAKANQTKSEQDIKNAQLFRNVLNRLGFREPPPVTPPTTGPSVPPIIPSTPSTTKPGIIRAQ